MESARVLYTVGTWEVKRGSESAFVDAWRLFASWSSNRYPEAGTAHLLQDTDAPGRFISFGPWESVEAVKSWRASPEFHAFLVRAKELCESFTPHSMRLTATSTSS